MSASNLLPLQHLTKWAENKNTAPTLFLLHGYGSNEEDLFSLAVNLPDQYNLISLRAPYPLHDFGYAWYAIDFSKSDSKWSDDKQGILSKNLILQFIQEACDVYQLDTSKLTLMGFSQGAILSYAIALSSPQMIKRVVALSGYIHKPFLSENFEKNNFEHLQIYTSHGIFDQIVPIEWAEKTPVLLNHLNIKHHYETFVAGHTVCTKNFHSLAHWLHITN